MAVFENISVFFKRFMQSEKKELVADTTNTQSKDAAKERLHVVLMQDRANVSADFLELMKEEIIEVIKKYIVIDESKIDVRLTNQENEDGSIGAPLLHANIPILNIRNDAKGEVLNEEQSAYTDSNNQKADSNDNNEDSNSIEKESEENQEQAEELKFDTKKENEDFADDEEDDDDVTFDDLLKAAEEEEKLEKSKKNNTKKDKDNSKAKSSNKDKNNNKTKNNINTKTKNKTTTKSKSKTQNKNNQTTKKEQKD